MTDRTKTEVGPIAGYGKANHWLFGVALAAAWLAPTVALSLIDPMPAPQWWHGGLVGSGCAAWLWWVWRY